MSPGAYSNSFPTEGRNSVGVMIVDDQEEGRLATQLAIQGLELADTAQIHVVSSIEEAIEVLSRQSIHVAFLDKDLGPDPSNPRHNGIECIGELLALQPHLKVVMVTASNNYQDAARAITLGAFDYIFKREEPALFGAKVRKAVEHAVRELHFALLSKQQSSSKSIAAPLGGSSLPWTRAIRQSIAFAETDLPILLRGQTGTGKTSLALAAHEHRKQHIKEPVKNFVNINIAAISDDMAERELFGNEAGAYTDAKRENMGYFELARDGTLFLDEIGDASLELQKKLLKVIETGKFFRLGGTVEIHSRFKLICATHRDLEQMVVEGTFREDLYMRISTLQVVVPSLEERKSDIPQIIEALTPSIAQKCRKQITFAQLPADLVEYLTETPHSGNVRGIERHLGRLFSMVPVDRNGDPRLGTWRTILEIRENPLPKERRRESLRIEDIFTLPSSLLVAGFPGHTQTIEKLSDLIYEEADERFSGRLADIAKALKVSRTTVYNNLSRIRARKNGLHKRRSRSE